MNLAQSVSLITILNSPTFTGTVTANAIQVTTAGFQGVYATNTVVATVATNNFSPAFETVANYWNGTSSLPDTWEMQSNIAAGINGISTLMFTHTGSSGAAIVSVPSIQINGATAITAQSGIGGTVAMTGAPTFTVNGTTVTISNTGATQFPSAGLLLTNPNTATVATTNQSCFTYFQANYWTSGAASAPDEWAMYAQLGAGANGTSTLVMQKITGSTGVAAVQVPLLNALTGYQANGTAGVSVGPITALTSITTSFGLVTALSGTSDERLKDYAPYAGGLQEILAITPAIYRWNVKGQVQTGLSGDRDFIGFIAQDVQRAIPLAITATEVSKDGTETYLSLDDRPIVAALVNAVKELKAEIDKLKRGESQCS